MSLKQRLNGLRRQAGVSGGAGSPSRGPALVDRLERLRPAGIPPHGVSRRVSVEEVARLVGGEVIGDGLTLIERRIPLEDTHGSIALHRIRDGHGALPEAVDVDCDRAVFLDTETTGLSGGTGTAVFLLGMGRVEGAALRVRQYLITSFAGETGMLRDAVDWLRQDDVLVSFNGKCFDVPLLVARCRLAGVDDPFGGLEHVDLLHPTRRAFASRWEDCRLGTAERELLAFVRENDLSGAQAPAAWFAYLHGGDASRLPAVVRHNHWDIVSLAALLPALAAAHGEPHRHGADPLAVARALVKRGDEGAALSLLAAGESSLDEAGLLELARLYRRKGAWEEARAVWERLAPESSEALERLAKYHEHRCRDYARALELARGLPPSAERDRRCRRLAEKLATDGARPAPMVGLSPT